MILRPPIAGAQYEAQTNEDKEIPTMDIVVIGLEILFFALSVAYIKVCDIL